MAVESERDLDVGMRCIKYMLCVANLMFVVVGLLLISIGYTIKAIYGNFEEFMEANYYNPSTLAIVIGFFIFAVAMFGCVGALRESTCLVNTYAFFLTIILVLEISVSIAANTMRPDIKIYIENNMRHAMDRLELDYNGDTWNATQFNLGCCGIRNYTDWDRYYGRKGYPLVDVVTDNGNITRVPPTCCVQEQCTNSSSLYQGGCLNRLTYIISQCALLLVVGALCVSFIQVLGIVFASMLAKSIRKVKSHRLVAREERRRQFYQEMLKNQDGATKTDKPVTLINYTPQDSEA